MQIDNKTPQMQVSGGAINNLERTQGTSIGDTFSGSRFRKMKTNDEMAATHTDKSPKEVKMGTTNKFSNFGFFAGSPRATFMAGA
jgi:hypothetical protein